MCSSPAPLSSLTATSSLGSLPLPPSPEAFLCALDIWGRIALCYGGCLCPGGYSAASRASASLTTAPCGPQSPQVQDLALPSVPHTTAVFISHRCRITNNHKLSSLKQQEFILECGSEVKAGPPGWINFLWLQARWLRRTEVCSLTVLEAGSPKSGSLGSPEALEASPLLASSSFSELPAWPGS